MIKELLIGGLLTHMLPVPPKIERTSTKTIVMVEFDSGVNVMVGQNSIGKPIAGLGIDFPLTPRTDFKVGAYVQNSKEFHKYDAYMVFGDIVPVLGFEVDFPLTKNVSLSTIITPPVLFMGFKVGF